LLRQQTSEIRRNCAHATPAVLRFRVRIVVRVSIDIVREGVASRIGYEFHPGNSDVIRGKKRLPGRQQRMLERGEDLKLVTSGDRGACARDGFNLAGIGRAQLEALGGIDPHGIDELTIHELDSRDERCRRLDVLLHQRDTISRLFEL
jgi:hypothetical protein